MKLCLSLFAGLVSLGAIPAIAGNEELAEARRLMTPERFLAHIRYLADDSMQGRSPGSEGIEKAAEYIAARFKEAGCQPAGDDGTFFQSFTVPRGKRLDEGSARFGLNGQSRPLRVNRDWRPFPFSLAGFMEGPLVFAGFGIHAPDHDYDDYAELDVKGKVVLIFRYEPRIGSSDAAFGGERPSRHSDFISKARAARDRGAAGLLIVNPPGEPADDALYEFDEAAAMQNYRLKMVHVSRKLAQDLLKEAGAPTLESLHQQILTARKPASRDLGVLKVQVNTGLEPVQIHTRNVVAMLPGDGTTEELVVVGAHYDHIGLGERGRSSGQIHNGADDNASGTAGILEIARVLGQQPRLRRGIVFIAFSAEEMGLLGSKHFVEHPTVDLSNVKAMVNLDMIGRYGQGKFDIHGADTAPEFPDIVDRAANDAGVSYNRPVSKEFFGRSDHAPFYRRSIPVLFPFTGIHDHYHKPGDDWELIDDQGGARVLVMMYSIIRDLAQLAAGPTFVSGKDTDAPPPAASQPASPAVAAGPAAANPHADATPSVPAMTVRLGVQPDYNDDGAGLRLDGVSDDSPAKSAGLREGDRITQLGEYPIEDIQTYMKALSRFSPGQKVKIIYLRDGKTLEVEVELAPWGRPSPK